MYQQHQTNLNWLWLVGIPLCSYAVLAPPVTAHTIKTAGDVAVNFHIDPNHHPKAGETATAWFAMTRRGGKSIPLQECHCKLAVYLDSSPDDLTQSMSTSLKSISTEQYQDLPAADLIFPQAGVYRLEFSGTPKQEGAFKPFRLTYNVTAIPGQTASSQVSPVSSNKTLSNSNPENNRQNHNLTTILSVTGVGVVIGAIASMLYQKKRRKQVYQNLEVKSQLAKPPRRG
ncbi:hypothetical protein [Merismopedia glauca]|uniref:Uncharacterized protein n=1 Tax=Merismopedia glauca CCAP 1448/3 TaxID=1296344 RepID=A0A2T1BYN0_9CYAN|nr:hypothetical protein [Merismopedia glauca]PSB01121.1 hypothetical protein C7B64_19935 [Merismopedia glauca CCAP 1448/3]